MGFCSRLALLVILSLSSLTIALSQNQSVESLRSQLSEVQKKEEELQARVRQLDEDLKPENIEKAFALNGSTHPEELREQRRRQLEGQKANVQTQLDQLAQSRTRLETSIATAEAAAYRQSALPADSSYSPTPAVNSGSTTTVKPKQSQRRTRQRRRPVRRRRAE
jgi:peptidoglycan hydrolase CwlO-like protein